MLHKRFIFVSLLAPSFSFASTATDSLANATRDTFDNLNENPAFVNAEGDKNYLRIGKAGGMQSITSVGGYGLGIQINTLKSELVGTGNSKELDAASKDLTKRGLPLSLSFGDGSEDLKWGAALQYQNAKVTGTANAPTFDPSFLKMGLRLGVVMDATEVAMGFGRNSWKVATTSKTKTTTGETPTNLSDGVSEQSTDELDTLVRHKMGEYQWFLALGQNKTKAKVWEAAKNATTSQDEFNKTQFVQLGAERSVKLTDAIMLYNKGWMGWQKVTTNASQQKKEITDLDFSSAHGVEVAASSWATLRAGVQASLYNNSKETKTDYSEANQAGTSAANTTTSTYVLGAAGSPTMGVGFKFGNYSIDATLAQDGTGNLGFSDKVLGMVEVTAQF